MSAKIPISISLFVYLMFYFVIHKINEFTDGSQQRRLRAADLFIKFHSYYSNSMVMQQDVYNNIWGYTNSPEISGAYSCL